MADYEPTSVKLSTALAKQTAALELAEAELRRCKRQGEATESLGEYCARRSKELRVSPLDDADLGAARALDEIALWSVIGDVYVPGTAPELKGVDLEMRPGTVVDVAPGPDDGYAGCVECCLPAPRHAEWCSLATDEQNGL
jgi:hypothetical protein